MKSPAAPRPPRPFAAVLALLLLTCVGAGCASSGLQAGNEVFRRGLEQAEAGDIEEAIAILEEGVAQHPGHYRMRFELARLQYEVGEAHHLHEREAMRAAAVFLEQGKREQALGSRKAATEHRAQAIPHYQAARQNLRVVTDDEDEEHRLAWASYLLMRTDVFFEDWEEAYLNIGRAIDLGRPTGPQLGQWREYQAALKEKVDGHSLP